jgi:hypothetical protein
MILTWRFVRSHHSPYSYCDIVNFSIFFPISTFSTLKPWFASVAFVDSFVFQQRRLSSLELIYVSHRSLLDLINNVFETRWKRKNTQQQLTEMSGTTRKQSHHLQLILSHASVLSIVQLCRWGYCTRIILTMRMIRTSTFVSHRPNFRRRARSSQKLNSFFMILIQTPVRMKDKQRT